MAFTCKALHNKITTRLVVRSAIMHGGNAGKTVKALYEFMDDKSIHIPSALRLLRLVNGNVCESCCSSPTMNFPRSGYGGVFLCSPCLKNAEKRNSWVRFNCDPRYQEIINHPRVVAKRLSSKYFTWARSIKLNGEKCDPLVTTVDIEHMAAASASIDSMLSDLELPTEQEYEELVMTNEASQADANAAALYRLQKKESASTQAREKWTTSSRQLISEIQAMPDVG
jgi:hypothetical protein